VVGERRLREEADAMRWVRRRVVASFVLLGVLALLGASLVAYELAVGTREPIDRARRAEAKVLHTAEIGRHGTAIAAFLYAHALAPLPSARIADIEHRLDETLGHLAALGPLVSIDEMLAYLRARLLLYRFQTAARAALAAGSRGERELALAALQDRVLPVLEEARPIVDWVIDKNQRAANRHFRESHDRMWRVLRATVLGVMLFIVLVAATGGYMLATVRRQQARIREQTLRREQALRDLDSFAGRIAHDIRGPLAPLVLASQTLRQSRDPEVLERASERIERCARHAADLVESLLAFSRAGEARAGGRCDVAAAVARALEQARHSAREARIDLAVDVPTCEGAMEAPLLAQVVQNLVSNAIRHMPADAATRRIAVRGRVVGDRCRIEVADTGRGIPPGLRGLVFRPFYQRDEQRGGTGLGLATVKRLVEGHNGEVGIEDNPGGGAVFWFTIPRAPSGRSGPVSSRKMNAS
jgi:two-component system, OmpR family, sensor kinase